MICIEDYNNIALLHMEATVCLLIIWKGMAYVTADGWIHSLIFCFILLAQKDTMLNYFDFLWLGDNVNWVANS